MVNRWAMIQNGTVINVCLWDGEVTTWQPPDGVEMQLAPDHVAIGWSYSNGEWTAPVIPEPEKELSGIVENLTNIEENA